MEKIGLLEGFIAAAACAWVCWISITTVILLVKNASTKKDFEALLGRLESISVELRADFSKMDGSVEEHINRVNNRFDLFLKSEIDLLKDVVKEKHSR